MDILFASQEKLLDKIPLTEIKDVTRGDKELMKMFEEWDVNKNGLISREEFEQVVCALVSLLSCLEALLIPQCLRFLN